MRVSHLSTPLPASLPVLSPLYRFHTLVAAIAPHGSSRSINCAYSWPRNSVCALWTPPSSLSHLPFQCSVCLFWPSPRRFAPHAVNSGWLLHLDNAASTNDTTATQPPSAPTRDGPRLIIRVCAGVASRHRKRHLLFCLIATADRHRCHQLSTTPPAAAAGALARGFIARTCHTHSRLNLDSLGYSSFPVLIRVDAQDCPN